MTSVGLKSLLLSSSAVALALAVGLAADRAAAQQTTASAAPGAAQKPQPAQAAAKTPAGPVKRAPAFAAIAGADGVINLDTITVTPTRTAESVVDAMAGASVVTGSDIRQQQPSSIAEALQNVPGVTSQISANDPGQSINIRGLQDFGRVNVLVDGARQDYQISGHNANGNFYLDPEFVGQADVVRGPVSNIYGSGAIGGVVSFRTHDINDLLAPDEKYGALEHVVGGTNGSGVVTSTMAGVRAGSTADLFGQFVYRKSTPYKDGLGDTVPDTGSRLAGGLLKFNYRPADGQQISATAMTQNYGFTNNTTELGGPRFHDDVTTQNYTLGYTLKSPETPLVDFSIKGYYTKTENDQTYLAADPDGVYPLLGVAPGAGLSDRIDTFGLDVHNTSRFNTGDFAHALTVGGDFSSDRVKTFDQAGGFIGALTPSGQRDLAGAFVQDEMSYGGWLRVLGAVRYDHYSLNGQQGGNNPSVDSSGSHISPKLTIGVTPIKGMEFYGTYAEGYRAPSITETLISGVHPFPAFTILPNPDLKPEVAHNLEAGVNLKYDSVFLPGDSVRAKATAFTNKVDNYIDFEPFGPTYLVSGIPGVSNSACDATPAPPFCFPITSFKYINVSKARLQGVELEGAYDWGGGFFSVSGTAVNGKDLTSGLSLSSVPPYRASGTLAFRLLDDRSLTIGGRATFVSASPKNVPAATDGSLVLTSSGYTLYDLFASYAYNKDVSGTLTVTNLFNKQYQQFLDSEADPGLTVKVGLSVKFASK